MAAKPSFKGKAASPFVKGGGRDPKSTKTAKGTKKSSAK